MKNPKKKSSKKQYQLLHIYGCVEPSLHSLCKDWKTCEKQLIKFVADDKYREEDGLFYVVLDGEGRLLEVSSFSCAYMDKIRTKAGKLLVI